jgi:hypothetical protein
MWFAGSTPATRQLIERAGRAALFAFSQVKQIQGWVPFSFIFGAASTLNKSVVLS